MTILETILKRWDIVLGGEIPVRIHGTRRDLADLFREVGFRKGVEVGVERGNFSRDICQRNPGVTLHCVDTWAKYPGYREHVTPEHYEEIYEDARRRLAPYGCRLVRKFSTAAAQDFPDRSLDFVYLDGNHYYEYVIADIAAWLPKIHKGGIISGHDYTQPTSKQDFSHVIDAVQGWTRSYFVNPWFVLNGESSGSWFWVVT